MELLSALKQVFGVLRAQEIFDLLGSRGVSSLVDLQYLDTISMEDIFPIEKKKLLELREQISLAIALEDIFGKQDPRLKKLEEELQKLGIDCRNDIPFIDLSLLSKLFKMTDLKKIERFIKKEYPDLLDKTNQVKKEKKFNSEILARAKEIKRLDDEGKRLNLRLEETKLVQKTLLELQSVLLEIENGNLEMDYLVEILKGAPKVALAYFSHPVVAAVKVMTVGLMGLIGFFTAVKRREEQKLILKCLLEQAEKELNEFENEVNEILKSICL